MYFHHIRSHLILVESNNWKQLPLTKTVIFFPVRSLLLFLISIFIQHLKCVGKHILAFEAANRNMCTNHLCRKTVQSMSKAAKCMQFRVLLTDLLFISFSPVLVNRSLGSVIDTALLNLSSGAGFSRYENYMHRVNSIYRTHLLQKHCVYISHMM